MERSEFDIIKNLMHELEEKMEYGEDDLSERLGRKKDCELKAMPMKDEGEMSYAPEHKGMSEKMGHMPEDEDIEDPEENLKMRIMKLRN
jgi:hypothetical protein